MPVVVAVLLVVVVFEEEDGGCCRRDCDGVVVVDLGSRKMRFCDERSCHSVVFGG